MEEIQITEVRPLEKGRMQISFENGIQVALYRSELREFSASESKLLLTVGAYIPGMLYQKIMTEIVGLRVKKRAMHLLERMDRTEHQLFDKLKQGGYPEGCIEEAIAYVKSYHYIDDLRYAKQYIRLGQEKKSRQRLQMDLMKKGIARETIEMALADEFSSDERGKIMALLEKRHYDYNCKDRKEQQKMYQFLMRRGYKSGDIMAVMRCGGE